MDLPLLKSMLEQARVRFATGLTAAEFCKIEETYGFTFPPDLREFLAYALPVSEGWVNWRDAGEDVIRDWLQMPYEGICWDIEHCHFWWHEWGERPSALEDAFTVAKRALDQVPTLIPIYGHRFMPAYPCLPGNSVYSMWQTDIIYYGWDLEDYLQGERHFILPEYKGADQIRRIAFWADLIDWMDPPTVK
jgi:hypothetical protein